MNSQSGTQPNFSLLIFENILDGGRLFKDLVVLVSAIPPLTYPAIFVTQPDLTSRSGAHRYNIFLNVPLNQEDLSPGAFYLAFYNELFINGQRDIGDDRMVELFDRNRTYGALGYSAFDGIRFQLGYMQQTTDNWSKGQIQVSMHHNF